VVVEGAGGIGRYDQWVVDIMEQEDQNKWLEVDRTHEECAECLLIDADPPQCHGHRPGPVSCDSFVDLATVKIQ